MKKTDLLVSLLMQDIADQKILEVACGCAEFSVSAARYAHSVSCIDIDGSRASEHLPSNDNPQFKGVRQPKKPAAGFAAGFCTIQSMESATCLMFFSMTLE